MTAAGMGELLNEFLPEEKKLHLIADIREIGKDLFWRMIKV